MSPGPRIWMRLWWMWMWMWMKDLRVCLARRTHRSQQAGWLELDSPAGYRVQALHTHSHTQSTKYLCNTTPGRPAASPGVALSVCPLCGNGRCSIPARHGTDMYCALVASLSRTGCLRTPISISQALARYTGLPRGTPSLPQRQPQRPGATRANLPTLVHSGTHWAADGPPSCSHESEQYTYSTGKTGRAATHM
ncbi:hypothetical protein K461DRAFT_171028 [Myriangium duriaei CBS 260.36]|uniref:Secreted protein n=1 Tax=Myriangium duriaei CBS 260.36 TaxID=1168546 RepID=A0A9P4IZG2_9PEZI|nr:hypothetical protein K461DRAFT_171028 [Myriangium duriaei CBS 260.36]